MISILIPVYNYSIVNLGNELLMQENKLDVPCEIIFFDDCSTNEKIKKENQLFCKNNNIAYHVSKKNLGRAEARNSLAELARYEWLLFMDSDVFPVRQDYLKKFILSISPTGQVYTGNILYRRDVSENYKNNLRWKYGIKYEENCIKNDNRSKYLYLKSANLMVRKKTFKHNFFPVLKYNYGYEDTMLGLSLEEKGVKLEIIQNPVYHDGLETSQVFLNKTEEAIRNLAELIREENNLCKRIKIIKLYYLLKKLNCVKYVKYLFEKNRNSMKKKLLSENSDVRIFQLYKFGYLCYLLAL